MYNPITATPFTYSDNYMEFIPCNALKPYIRCFWGTRKPVYQEKTNVNTTGIVTPDTCMDIMFHVDFTNNRIRNSFCGINDRTFSITNCNDSEQTIFSFAIRFYAWSIPMFSEEKMCDTRNSHFDVGYHFSKIKKEMETILFEVSDVYELIPKVEKILISNYNIKHENTLVLQAVEKVLRSRGTIDVGELKNNLHISDRQLERLFREYVGVTPKSLAAMVRYQYLWNDIIFCKQFDIQDAVYKYGYADQAHLYHDFKKYHSMNIADAKRYALQNVEKIQESYDDL
jgi:AraC-like DNA-binding protein